MLVVQCWCGKYIYMYVVVQHWCGRYLYMYVVPYNVGAENTSTCTYILVECIFRTNVVQLHTCRSIFRTTDVVQLHTCILRTRLCTNVVHTCTSMFPHNDCTENASTCCSCTATEDTYTLVRKTLLQVFSHRYFYVVQLHTCRCIHVDVVSAPSLYNYIHVDAFSAPYVVQQHT